MPADRLLHPRAGHSEKVSALSSEAYRVWTQYLLSADDFGVMVRSAAKLQAENYWLQQCPPHRVAGWLEEVIAAALVVPFAHQGRQFVYQPDWQRWQKVEYPRATIHPRPDDATLDASCDERTRRLFEKHPGGTFPKRVGKHSESTSPVIREVLSTPRVTANGIRHTANGKRLTADGLEGEPEGEAPAQPPADWAGDEALAQLQADYPQNRVTDSYTTRTAFVEQLGADPPATFARMQAQLEQHKRSHEWRVRGMIPSLERWLRDALWKRTLDEDPPAGEQLTAKTSRTLAAAAAIMREKP